MYSRSTLGRADREAIEKLLEKGASCSDGEKALLKARSDYLTREEKEIFAEEEEEVVVVKEKPVVVKEKPVVKAKRKMKK